LGIDKFVDGQSAFFRIMGGDFLGGVLDFLGSVRFLGRACDPTHSGGFTPENEQKKDGGGAEREQAFCRVDVTRSPGHSFESLRKKLGLVLSPQSDGPNTWHAVCHCHVERGELERRFRVNSHIFDFMADLTFQETKSP